MICPECKLECLEKDFILKQMTCFRCTYRLKNKKNIIKKPEVINFCRMCKGKIIFDENARKRQRSIYCSEVCAEKGHIDKSNNYWTRKLMETCPFDSR
jgi:hypothetical protein